MSTVEISKEERDLWRFEASDECGTPSEEDERILRLLNALEITEGLLDSSVQETRANFSAVYQACTEIIPNLKAKLEAAEAQVARLTAERDWLAMYAVRDVLLPYQPGLLQSAEKVKEAARRAVDGEGKA